jgi:hypothetical protein
MKTPHVGVLDYDAMLKESGFCSANETVAFPLKQLRNLWREAYIKMTLRQTDIVIVRHKTFEYLYDHYPALQPGGALLCDDLNIEPRLVAVFGHSSPQKGSRDDYRLKGWVGPTEKMFGRLWDKGHFIAHSIGGAVDGLEVNVFIQRRDLNRGWSAAGKRFRKMENYCVLNPGTFCFCRPLYIDQTAKPAFMEFGVLKNSREFWVECFDNQ